MKAAGLNSQVFVAHVLLAGMVLAQPAPYDLGTLPSVVSAIQWPAPPVTSTVVDVSTIGELQAAVAQSNVLVNVAAGTYTGNVRVSGSDVDVVCSNDATIEGRLFFGDDNARPSRLRWTGGNMDGGPLDADGGTDFLIDNLNAVTYGTGGGGDCNNFTGGPNGVQRVALINSTLRITNGDGRGDWAWYNSPGQGVSDIILANVRMESDAQNNRFQGINRLIIKDSYFNSEYRSANALRIEKGNRGVWIANTIIAGSNIGVGASDPHAYDIVIEGVARYHDQDNFWGVSYNAVNGTLNNCPGYTTTSNNFGGEMNIGTMTGSNNIIHQWDGVTVPSAAGYGADHPSSASVAPALKRAGPRLPARTRRRAFTLDGRFLTPVLDALWGEGLRLPHGAYLAEYLDTKGKRLQGQRLVQVR